MQFDELPPEVQEYLRSRDADDKPSFVLAECAGNYRWVCKKGPNGWTGERGNRLDEDEAEDLTDEQRAQRDAEMGELDEILERATKTREAEQAGDGIDRLRRDFGGSHIVQDPQAPITKADLISGQVSREAEAMQSLGSLRPSIGHIIRTTARFTMNPDLYRMVESHFHRGDPLVIEYAYTHDYVVRYKLMVTDIQLRQPAYGAPDELTVEGVVFDEEVLPSP